MEYVEPEFWTDLGPRNNKKDKKAVCCLANLDVDQDLTAQTQCNLQVLVIRQPWHARDHLNSYSRHCVGFAYSYSYYLFYYLLELSLIVILLLAYLLLLYYLLIVYRNNSLQWEQLVLEQYLRLYLQWVQTLKRDLVQASKIWTNMSVSTYVVGNFVVLVPKSSIPLSNAPNVITLCYIRLYRFSTPNVNSNEVRAASLRIVRCVAFVKQFIINFTVVVMKTEWSAPIH